MSRRSWVIVGLSAALTLAPASAAAGSAPAVPAAMHAFGGSFAGSTAGTSVGSAVGAGSLAASAHSTVSASAHAEVLRPGAGGARVVSLQRRLAALGYWTGTTAGRYDHATAQAVMALQKVAGLSRDGVAGPATFRALDRGVRPKARSTSGRVVEIDLRRQVLLLVADGRVRYVVNTSTGTAATPTPKGSYRAFRQIDRWHTAPLGKLYRPKYFHRGYAVHGVADGNVPGHPASHGCARVSTKAMDMLWGSRGLRIGDRVSVY